jgi:ferredoxin
MGYYMTYLKNVSTLRYDPEKCAGCGRCVEVCPQEVFEMQDRKAAVIDKNRCMECGACSLNCDFGALAVNAGVGCAAAVINSIFSGGEPVCGCSENAGVNPGKTNCC